MKLSFVFRRSLPARYRSYLVTATQSNKLELIFLQTAPQLGHQRANVPYLLSRLIRFRQEVHVVIQRRFECFAALVQQWLPGFNICAALPWSGTKPKSGGHVTIIHYMFNSIIHYMFNSIIIRVFCVIILPRSNKGVAKLWIRCF